MSKEAQIFAVDEKCQSVKEKYPGFKHKGYSDFSLNPHEAFQGCHFSAVRGPVWGATGSHVGHPCVQPSPPTPAPPGPPLLSLINKGQLSHLPQGAAAARTVHRAAQGEAGTAHAHPCRGPSRPSRPYPHQARSRSPRAAAWPPASSAALPYAHPAQPHPTARRIQIRPLPLATRKARLLRPAPPQGSGRSVAASAPWRLGRTYPWCALGRLCRPGEENYSFSLHVPGNQPRRQPPPPGLPHANENGVEVPSSGVLLHHSSLLSWKILSWPWGVRFP